LYKREIWSLVLRENIDCGSKVRDSYGGGLGRLLSSGLWRPLIWYIITDVSEERVSSILRLEEYPEDGGNMFLQNDFIRLQGVKLKKMLVVIDLSNLEWSVEKKQLNA
jgi:hypothetical protein